MLDSVERRPAKEFKRPGLYAFCGEREGRETSQFFEFGGKKGRGHHIRPDFV